MIKHAREKRKCLRERDRRMSSYHDLWCSNHTVNNGVKGDELLARITEGRKDELPYMYSNIS